MIASRAARFWAKVKKTEACWEWTATKGAAGYGHFRAGSKQPKAAHRLSWEIHFGEIPAGLFVCHRCDNRACVNPAHLFLGTHADNMADMARKHRYVLPLASGELHPNAKLTAVKVMQIRGLLAAGLQCTVIAQKFGVSRAAIGDIKHGRKWLTMSSRAPAL